MAGGNFVFYETPVVVIDVIKESKENEGMLLFQKIVEYRES
jgi:hypothetical protein